MTTTADRYYYANDGRVYDRQLPTTPTVVMQVSADIDAGHLDRIGRILAAVLNRELECFAFATGDDFCAPKS